MLKPKKLIFFDIDGTLLRTNQPQNLEKIKILIKSMIKNGICLNKLKNFIIS